MNEEEEEVNPSILKKDSPPAISPSKEVTFDPDTVTPEKTTKRKSLVGLSP